jgi:5-methyltetrahydrofolate--homocysteine methyltransferase
VIGFYPANADGDDVVLWANAARVAELGRVRFLRQQMAKQNDRPNYCLADFVAPRASRLDDYLGMFAVTIDGDLEDRVAEFRAQGDDYSAIMLKALADRLAEACAESLHEDVRREHWGYAPDEQLDNESLIRERYRGIRPAPGYPACPDHTEKRSLFEQLDATRRIGVRLTESCAMMPTASVSGYYFAHPEARYFGVGRIGRDQVHDYAERRGMTIDEATTALHTLLEDA